MNAVAAQIRTQAYATPPQPMAASGPIDVEQLSRHVQVLRRKLAAGQHAYRAGQPFHAIYLVHAGFLKSCELSEDGRITGLF